MYVDLFWDTFMSVDLFSVPVPTAHFENCDNLTTVTINSNSIASFNLADTFGSGVETYIIGDSVTSIGAGAFSGCTGLTGCTIGSGITSIGAGTFSGCSNLYEINIPSGVTSIGANAFSGCSSLYEIYCYSVTPPNTNGNFIFGGITEYGTLYVPTGSVNSYEQWYNFTNELVPQNWEIAEM